MDGRQGMLHDVRACSDTSRWAVLPLLEYTCSLANHPKQKQRLNLKASAACCPQTKPGKHTSICCTSSMSYWVTNERDQPRRPARAVRPTLCYAAVQHAEQGYNSCLPAHGELFAATSFSLDASSKQPRPISQRAKPTRMPHGQVMQLSCQAASQDAAALHVRRIPPVHVIPCQLRQVVIDHQIHGGDVQAPGSHIRGQQHRHLRVKRS